MSFWATCLSEYPQTCMPPNGEFLFLITRPICSCKSKGHQPGWKQRMKAVAFVIIPIYQTRSHLSLILLVHNELACFNTYSSRYWLSSMTKVLVSFHLVLVQPEPLTFLTSVSMGSLPSPTPAKEWSVVPPMLMAAIPVDAVTATAESPKSSRSCSMIALSRTLLPVPGGTNG